MGTTTEARDAEEFLRELPMPERVANATGETVCIVRWMIEQDGRWVGAHDRDAITELMRAAFAAGMEAAARVCEELDGFNEDDPGGSAADAIRAAKP